MLQVESLGVGERTGDREREPNRRRAFDNRPYVRNAASMTSPFDGGFAAGLHKTRLSDDRPLQMNRHQVARLASVTVLKAVGGFIANPFNSACCIGLPKTDEASKVW